MQTALKTIGHTTSQTIVLKSYLSSMFDEGRTQSLAMWGFEPLRREKHDCSHNANQRSKPNQLDEIKV